MPDMHIEIHKEGTHARFTCRGTASVEGYNRVIECVRATMASPGSGRKALVDISAVEGELSEMQKFSMGEFIASRLLGMRIGVIMNPNTPLTRFGETTAVNRGADLLVSHDAEEILAWLALPATAGADASRPAGPA